MTDVVLAPPSWVVVMTVVVIWLVVVDAIVVSWLVVVVTGTRMWLTVLLIVMTRLIHF